jgi:hypothetical protein
MRSMILIVGGVLITGCQQAGDQYRRLPPPEAFVKLKDRVAVRMLQSGIPWTYPCMEPGRCLKYDGPKRIRGLWRNDFEGSQFCEAPATQCSFDMPGPRTWLDARVSFPTEFKRRDLGGLYAVDFIGRSSQYRGNYGHVGVFDKEVIVDRIISIREIEPPPKR